MRSESSVLWTQAQRHPEFWGLPHPCFFSPTSCLLGSPSILASYDKFGLVRRDEERNHSVGSKRAGELPGLWDWWNRKSEVGVHGEAHSHGRGGALVSWARCGLSHSPMSNEQCNEH